MRSRTRQVEIVERIAIWRHHRWIADAVGVLPERRFRREEAPQCVAVRLGRFAPIGPDRIPAVAEAFLIGVAVLRDDRRDTLRMLERNPQTDWRAVIENVDRKPLEVHDLRKAADDFGQSGERIGKSVARRQIGLSEPGQIRRDNMKTVGKQRNEIAKHVAAGRESMEQQQRWGICRSGLPVKDLHPVDADRPIGDFRHESFLPRLDFRNFANATEQG